MGRLITWWVGAVLALYVLYGIAMVWLHPQFIYPFAPDIFDHPAYARQEIEIPGREPLPVHIYDAGEKAPVVVYFMGNVGALDFFLSMLDHHRSQGRSVVAMTYRGGGGTAGAPSEAQLKSDAVAVMDALPALLDGPRGPLVVHGFSLGTGLALHVGAREEVGGILLSAPYATLCSLMARASKLPACVLPGIQAWESVNDVAGISAPVLIQHGDADTLIPPVQSARLTNAMEQAGVDVTRRLIPGGGHNTLMSQPGYLSQIDSFIGGLGATK